jgi:N-acetylglucosamine transport system permease protein
MTVNQGGPDNATQLLSMEIYKTGFGQGQAGYSSAIGVVLFFLTLTFAALTMRVTRRDALEA